MNIFINNIFKQFVYKNIENKHYFMDNIINSKHIHNVSVVPIDNRGKLSKYLYCSLCGNSSNDLGNLLRVYAIYLCYRKGIFC